MDIAALTDDEKLKIPIDQLARLLLGDARRRTGGPPNTVGLDPWRFVPDKTPEPLKSQLAGRLIEALEILLDRGLLRWAGGGATSLFDPRTAYQITSRGIRSDLDKGWVAPPEPALAKLYAEIAPSELDPILEAYLGEAVGALYTERLLSVELCMGIVAEQTAWILWDRWLTPRVTTRLKSDWSAYDIIETCVKGLDEVRPTKAPAERDQLEEMKEAMRQLGHTFRLTRNQAAHPTVPRDPDETVVSVQLATLLHTYVPALYRVLAIP